MMLIYTYPFSDVRHFLDADTHKLAKPTFPVPIIDQQFLRSSGPIKGRLRGGSTSAPGEDVYAEAKLACRLPGDNSWSNISSGQYSYRLRCILRRFYHTGDAISRFELGFSLRNTQSSPAAPGDFDLLKKVSSIQVRIPQHDKPDNTAELSAAGPYFAKHFLYATTHLKNGDVHKITDWWLDAGAPAIVIEKDSSEPFTAPKTHVTINALNDPNISLRHFKLFTHKSAQPVSVWLIEFNQTADLRNVRQLRMHLVRVHAEAECLRKTLQLIKLNKITINPLSPETRALKNYLSRSKQRLSKKRRYGTSQQDILQAAYEYQSEALPGSLSSMLASTTNILDKIEMENNMAEKYHPAGWEKKLVAGVAVFLVALVAVLALRNEPIKDANIVVMLRMLVSLGVASLGAVIPGFFTLNWKGKGLAIKATGALALFVLTYMFTPGVLPNV